MWVFIMPYTRFNGFPSCWSRLKNETQYIALFERIYKKLFAIDYVYIYLSQYFLQ